MTDVITQIARPRHDRRLRRAAFRCRASRRWTPRPVASARARRALCRGPRRSVIAPVESDDGILSCGCPVKLGRGRRRHRRRARRAGEPAGDDRTGDGGDADRRYRRRDQRLARPTTASSSRPRANRSSTPTRGQAAISSPSGAATRPRPAVATSVGVHFTLGGRRARPAAAVRAPRRRRRRSASRWWWRLTAPWRRSGAVRGADAQRSGPRAIVRTLGVRRPRCRARSRSAAIARS